MTSKLPVINGYSLRAHNSFGIDAKARAYLAVQNTEMLAAVRADPELAAMPRLVLGGGSNILLTGDFDGLVLHLCSRGMRITGEDAGAVQVSAAAGENWHDFVRWTLAQGLGGLENLSLIPGSVGAAPIQNIGAYGAELKGVLHAVEIFDFESGLSRTLTGDECEFAYRDSIFKHELRERAVILEVRFALPKQWRPNLSYAELAQEIVARGLQSPTASEISDAVIAIRTRKLPDPAQLGNAGSFFKNPVVPASVRDALLARYPELVSYAQPDGSYKLGAGWMIDRCGWKGKSVGDAGVYEKQALVLVNRGNAKGQEILGLAESIRADVQRRFGVLLEPEPVFV
jgi:UDP-N-acetylmuramate dehydrogenase